MTTVKQIDRQWTAKAYGRLFHELVSTRPESSFCGLLDARRPVISAAMAIIRLEELSQSHAPVYPKLLRTLLAAQEADGGWGDLMGSALCLRALLCGRGNGIAIDRALGYFANLQKTEGIWPNEPIRRMPADPYLSAFILFQLGDHARFREAVRLVDAATWFETHDSSLDAETRRLWTRAGVRCRVHVSTEHLSVASLC